MLQGAVAQPVDEHLQQCVMNLLLKHPARRVTALVCAHLVTLHARSPNIRTGMEDARLLRLLPVQQAAFVAVRDFRMLLVEDFIAKRSVPPKRKRQQQQQQQQQASSEQRFDISLLQHPDSPIHLSSEDVIKLFQETFDPEFTEHSPTWYQQLQQLEASYTQQLHREEQWLQQTRSAIQQRAQLFLQVAEDILAMPANWIDRPASDDN